ncbi:uncharacterized protein J3D65DRAFT_609626 [Phyllosticta citribraziliensis]|uniref:Uncharacterized protein n=1 Tax=Phyllosticta citribraziliensis TaxID=989973 RepID=A0ABR1MCW6_9PEZI
MAVTGAPLDDKHEEIYFHEDINSLPRVKCKYHETRRAKSHDDHLHENRHGDCDPRKIQSLTDSPSCVCYINAEKRECRQAPGKRKTKRQAAKGMAGKTQMPAPRRITNTTRNPGANVPNTSRRSMAQVGAGGRVYGGQDARLRGLACLQYATHLPAHPRPGRRLTAKFPRPMASGQTHIKCCVTLPGGEIKGGGGLIKVNNCERRVVRARTQGKSS